MLTEAGCKSRRERLFSKLPADVEWVLVADPRHVMYLANFWVQPISFSNGERAALLVERDGKATLLGDNFALRSAATEPFVDEEIVTPWYDHKHSTTNRDHALLAAVRQVSDRLTGRKGLVEGESFPAGGIGLAGDHAIADVSGGELDLGNTLRHLRRQKDADEVAQMNLCMRACEAGHAWARENVKPGMTDMEVYLGVSQTAMAAAGRPAIVYGDFRKCSPTAWKQGGLPVGESLNEGDTFVLDYTVMLDGYRSDFTNAIAIGEVSEQLRANFATCQAAMAAGEDTLAAGVACKDVYAAVKGQFNDAGIGESFHHHAGHGLGLGHPEWPTLVPESTDTLLAGDVVTLEPGSYVEGVGGMRIEHNYLITNDGYERLSNHIISLD